MDAIRSAVVTNEVILMMLATLRKRLILHLPSRTSNLRRLDAQDPGDVPGPSSHPQSMNPEKTVKDAGVPAWNEILHSLPFG
jgi:hypothetical protein